MQNAENKVSLACKAVDAEENALTSARKLIEEDYDKRKKVVTDAITSLNQQIANVPQEIQDFLNKASALERQAAGISIPDVPSCPKLAPPGCSDIRDAVERRANDARKAISELQSTASELRNHAHSISAAVLQQQLDVQKAALAKLDDLEKADKAAKDSAFQPAIADKRGALDIAEMLIAEERKENAKWKRADIRLRASPLVWKHDDKELKEGFSVVPDLSPPPPAQATCGSH